MQYIKLCRSSIGEGTTECSSKNFNLKSNGSCANDAFPMTLWSWVSCSTIKSCIVQDEKERIHIWVERAGDSDLSNVLKCFKSYNLESFTTKTARFILFSKSTTSGRMAYVPVECTNTFRPLASSCCCLFQDRRLTAVCSVVRSDWSRHLWQVLRTSERSSSMIILKQGSSYSLLGRGFASMMNIVCLFIAPDTLMTQC